MASSTRDLTVTPTGKPWREDFDAIAMTMAEALRGRCEGWESVEAPDLLIQDFSGFGGGKAYKLTCRSNPSAPAAALHVLDEFFCAGSKEPIFFERQRVAQALLAEAGVSPARICQDPDREWYVEEWVGDNIGQEASSIELSEEVGRLIARTHAIDTAWFDDIRRRQCERNPALLDAPRGSHIWFFAAFPQHFLEVINEAMLRAWIQAGPVPVTEVGSRLVTTHGDVHKANLARNDKGLKLIDFEASCVNYAVHDIGYAFGLLCETDELKEALTRAYLVECGLPASPEDVFALRLDAERCKMVTNHYDTNSLWQLIHLRRDLDDLGPVYPRLVAAADQALVDEDLADEIVTKGFERCAAVLEVQREGGKPLIGMAVTAHRGTPEPIERSALAVNWDGTIESTWERYRAVVLGMDEHGQVVLTNCLNIKERLQLRMSTGRIPTTGLRAPASPAIPFCLAGKGAGKALVLSDFKWKAWDNDLEFVNVGPREKAMLVHFEPDGVIRLADRPLQAFDCERGRTITGTKIQIFHAFCEDHQKFVLNDDATLSPIGNRDVVWGKQGIDVRLVHQSDQSAQRLTVSDEVAAAARVEGPGTLVDDAPSASDEGAVLELESHPGMALSVGPYEDRDDVKSLILVPVADAEQFVIAADHLRLANGGGRIAIGTPLRDAR